MAVERIPYPEYLKMSEGWSQWFYSDDIESILLPVMAELLGQELYPPPHDVFQAFYQCPLETVQVVVIGEEPYNSPHATGLAFEVRENHLLTSALQNIYRELEDEGFHPTKDGDLSGWSRQGVLLLNCALTVPRSGIDHLSLWKPFLMKLLGEMSKKSKIIWLLLGEHACAYREEIELFNESHLILTASHPSRLTANQASNDIPAFLRSNVFRRINEKLRGWKKKEIVW